MGITPIWRLGLCTNKKKKANMTNEEKLIEKACEWLKNNAGAYQEDLREYGEGCEYDTQSLIEDFKKAMEE